MSGALKSILPIGGAVAGGFLGGPAGAVLGGVLGSQASGVGEVRTPGTVYPASIGGAPLDVGSLAHSWGFGKGFSAPGFNFDGNTLSRGATNQQVATNLNTAGYALGNVAGGLNAARGNLAGMNPNTALTAHGNSLAELRGQVRPGFGRLTEARVQAIRNAGAESIGNLRESLSRRGVMGSSFANDAETRTRMATGQEEERARAEAMVEEIGMTRQIISDEITNRLNIFAAEMGITQEERANFTQQGQMIAQQATVWANQLDREFNEMGMVGSVRNNMNMAISQQAIQMAQIDMMQRSDNAKLQQQANLANAGFGMDANMANANNQAGFAGLGLSSFVGPNNLTTQINSGLRSVFGGGVFGSSANSSFGRGAFGMIPTGGI